jgi:DNA polymerase
MHKPPPVGTTSIADTAEQPGPHGAEQHVLFRDYETHSRLKLKSVGTHRYAAAADTGVTCCDYAVGDEPVKLWQPGDAIPVEFVEAANNPHWTAVAHGDHFESAIERHIMASRFGFPIIPAERHACTMAMALAFGLPARLSAAADTLELANRKDAAGERLRQQMSKPRRARQGEDPSQIHWFDDEDRLQRLYAYNKQDVETMRELFWRLRCCR